MSGLLRGVSASGSSSRKRSATASPKAGTHGRHASEDMEAVLLQDCRARLDAASTRGALAVELGDVEAPMHSLNGGVKAGADSTAPRGMLVSFKDVTYTVFVRNSLFQPAEPKQLLLGVEGHFCPGRMTALMGPSGSGKTTLLDVLAGRKSRGRVEGSIKYGGHVPTTAFLRRSTGYVEQFDTLVENLTPFEMLSYTADMKLPITEPPAAKRQRVEALIRYLELGSCKDSRIGGHISGGQAKRVNIGVSIITSPMILYCDEPTSGLDSFTADEVMSFVRTLTADGMTVCATIHSPSPTTFALFDTIMLLIGGKVVYFGDNGQPCLDYFAKSGLPGADTQLYAGREAEWVVGIITEAGNSGLRDLFAEAFTASPLHAAQAAVRQSMDAALAADPQHAQLVQREGDDRAGKATAVPWWWAVRKIFTYRILRNYSEPMFVSARIVDKAIVVGIMVTLFLGMGSNQSVRTQTNVAAALFMWSTQPALGCSSYLPTIMLERRLFQRERADGLYYSSTYYLAKWLQEVLLAIPSSLVFCMLVFLSLKLQGSFLLFWLSFFVTLLTSIAVAFTFATICPTIDFANGAVPSYGGTLLFFVGFLVPQDQIPKWWWWYSYTNYLRYPFAAMMINQFYDNPTSFQTQGTTYNNILAFYSMEPGTSGLGRWSNLALQLPFLLFFAAAAAYILKTLRYGAR